MANAARIPDINPPFELDNRGKRSVAINLADPEGYRAARRLSTAPTCLSPISSRPPSSACA